MAKKNILYRSKLKNAKNLVSENKLEEARELLLKLSKQAPKDGVIWLLLGFIAGKRHQYDEAIDCFDKALSLDPENAKVSFNYGIALRDAGKLDRAIDAFKKSLAKDQKNTGTMECLAHAYMMSGMLDDAEELYKTSLKIDPSQAETQLNLGCVHQAKGRHSDAENCYRAAQKIKPSLNIYENLASVLVSQGRFDESVEISRLGLQKYPNNSRLFSNYLLILNYPNNMTSLEVFKQHEKYGDTFDNKNCISAPSIDVTENQRIRIGYCSPDFREHSVAFFVEPIFEQYDKKIFEVFGYNLSPKYDEVTKRLKSKVDHWREISGKTAIEIAEIVKDDKIDILVDLAGHTAHNCLLAFVEKPAPVQITYLGYPNTTGLSSMQYRITDNYADLSDQDQYYTEKLVRLPDSFLCYRPDDNAPDVSEPPCVSNGYVTFGSFNNLSKINENVITTWCDVLHAVENSKIIIKNIALTDSDTRDRYSRLFVNNGINNDRLELIGHTQTRYEHLTIYNKIDISLDTFPYNGTTTTCEALWMGVPVIVNEGMRHSARVGLSLLTAADCNEWIAKSEAEYISIATELALDKQKLIRRRHGQRNKISESNLCDAKKFVASLEAMYINIIKMEQIK